MGLQKYFNYEDFPNYGSYEPDSNVDVELVNTPRQIFAPTDSIWVYGGNIPELVHGSGVIV